MTRDELRTLEAQAEQGDAEARYRAGCARHDDDNEALRDLDRALRWLRLASDQGHVRADRRLGYIHVVDLADPVQGAAYYARAAEQGDASAASSLGHLHGDRDQYPALYDLAEGVRWLERGLAGGHERDASWLGLLLLLRENPHGDARRATALLARGSAAGFLQAAEPLWAYAGRNLLVPVFVSAAPSPEAPPFPFRPARDRLLPDADVGALEHLARKGSAEAAHDLGVLCVGDPRGDARAIPAAWSYFLRAAEQGVPAAQFAAACLALTDADLRNVRLAIRLLRHAGAQGHLEAERALAWLDAHYRLHVRVEQS